MQAVILVLALHPSVWAMVASSQYQQALDKKQTPPSESQVGGSEQSTTVSVSAVRLAAWQRLRKENQEHRPRRGGVHVKKTHREDDAQDMNHGFPWFSCRLWRRPGCERQIVFRRTPRIVNQLRRIPAARYSSDSVVDGVSLTVLAELAVGHQLPIDRASVEIPDASCQSSGSGKNGSGSQRFTTAVCSDLWARVWSADCGCHVGGT